MILNLAIHKYSVMLTQYRRSENSFFRQYREIQAKCR